MGLRANAAESLRRHWNVRLQFLSLFFFLNFPFFSADGSFDFRFLVSFLFGRWRWRRRRESRSLPSFSRFRRGENRPKLSVGLLAWRAPSAPR